MDRRKRIRQASRVAVFDDRAQACARGRIGVDHRVDQRQRGLLRRGRRRGSCQRFRIRRVIEHVIGDLESLAEGGGP